MPERRPQRDQAESVFTRILADLVARVPSANAAALVDVEGETVDYAGRTDAYVLRVAAAHWRIVWADLVARPFVALPSSFAVRTSRSGVVVRALPEGYALVLFSARSLRPETYARAVSVCAAAVSREAGWSGSQPPLWYATDIAQDPQGNPRGLRQTGVRPPEPLDIIGRYRARLGWRERAWRVRSGRGIEAMLVRDAHGYWYADEDLNEPQDARQRGKSAGAAQRG